MKETDPFLHVPANSTPDEVINHCIGNAAELRVSDLFFTTHENHVSVLARHLGFMRVVTVLPLELGRRCIAQIKATAGMDVAEKRRPLDGRWVRRFGERKVDVRISTIPTLHGEDMTLRLLVHDFAQIPLEDLGLLQREHNFLLDILNSPAGLILVTGPTGSGKTTTLYACLRYLNNGKRKINTIEDPIEYAVEGIRQSQVNPQLDIDFPDLLRAVLRQAPDIIMIGEIRDPITAEVAVRAANSGHLVLATLHAPLAAGAIQSMLSLGVHPHFLSSSLRGVIAQRLVRTLCPKCRQPFDLADAPLTFNEVRPWLEPDEGKTLYVPDGCAHCLQSGYDRRNGIFEVLPISPNLRGLIQGNSSMQTIQQQAVKEGMLEMRLSALIKVARGQTTVEEVLRVVPVEYLGRTQ